MHGSSAIIFIPDDTAKTGYTQPLMLFRVMGTPLLSWLAQSLCENGVERFFLVCQDRYIEAARACFRLGAEVVTTMDHNPSDLLHVFLSTAQDHETTVTVVTGPAVFLPNLNKNSSRPSCVCCVSREALMAALDERFSFASFLKENGAILSDNDGMYSVDSPAAALEFAEPLRRNRMLSLCKAGVEIYDPASCYIEPTVRIKPGAKLLPGTVLRGKTVIGDDAVIGPWSVIEDSEIGAGTCVNASQVTGTKIGANASIGPYANIRPDCTIENGVKVGNFVELKNTRVGEDSWISHLSYAGDAEIGARCNLGCGAVTVNFDRALKHKTTIGDDAFIGCNSSLIAPITVGDGAYIAAGSTLTSDIPAQSLGIARVRQVIKRDWAAKHKKK